MCTIVNTSIFKILFALFAWQIQIKISTECKWVNNKLLYTCFCVLCGNVRISLQVLLRNIQREVIESQWHNTFKEKKGLNYPGFGPIAEDDLVSI